VAIADEGFFNPATVMLIVCAKMEDEDELNELNAILFYDGLNIHTGLRAIFDPREPEAVAQLADDVNIVIVLGMYILILPVLVIASKVVIWNV
jgi:hypothetical protein